MVIQIHDLINKGNIDSQVVGIIITFPITGEERQPITITHEKCKKCERQKGYGNFCSHCGGEFHTVTEHMKDGNRSWTGRTARTQTIPLPDVRAEMKELGIENHLPMEVEVDQYRPNDEVPYEYTDEWKFVYVEYETLGHRSHYSQPFLEVLDLKKIQKDLEEAKVKFKDILEKYNGRVVFGIAGQHTDW
jgi:hypothetical protein